MSNHESSVRDNGEFDIGVGAGIFKILVKYGCWSGISLMLWIIGGLMSLFGSLVYIELGIPRGIGEQKYIEAFPNIKNLGQYLALLQF
ncbi:11130_t:CDS:2, partial [Dentiscutata erythropus]